MPYAVFSAADNGGVKTKVDGRVSFPDRRWTVSHPAPQAGDEWEVLISGENQKKTVYFLLPVRRISTAEGRINRVNEEFTRLQYPARYDGEIVTVNLVDLGDGFDTTSMSFRVDVESVDEILSEVEDKINRAIKCLQIKEALLANGVPDDFALRACAYGTYGSATVSHTMWDRERHTDLIDGAEERIESFVNECVHMKERMDAFLANVHNFIVDYENIIPAIKRRWNYIDSAFQRLNVEKISPYTICEVISRLDGEISPIHLDEKWVRMPNGAYRIREGVFAHQYSGGICISVNGKYVVTKDGAESIINDVDADLRYKYWHLGFCEIQDQEVLLGDRGLLENWDEICPVCLESLHCEVCGEKIGRYAYNPNRWYSEDRLFCGCGILSSIPYISTYGIRHMNSGKGSKGDDYISTPGGREYF